jgi:hypothetical protein
MGHPSHTFVILTCLSRLLPIIIIIIIITDSLCGLMVRVLDYRSRGPGFDFRALPEKNVMGLERGPLSLVSTTEELLDRKVAAPV